MAGQVNEGRHESPLLEVKTEPEIQRNVLRLIRIKNGSSWRIAQEKENRQLLPLRVDLTEAKSWYQHSNFSSIEDQNVSSILPSGVFHRGT